MTDFRLAFRSLARAPIFAAAIILTIALGVGATTAVFSIIYGVLYRPLPYPDADRLVAVWETVPPNPNRDPETAAFHSRRAFIPDSLLNQWRDKAQSFDEIGGFAWQTFSVATAGEVENAEGAVATSGFFRVLGARPMLGRLLHPDDDVPGRGEVIVLGYGFWKRRFAGDPNIVGRAVTIDGASHVVVGVLRPDFHLVLQYSTLGRDPAFYTPVTHQYRPGLPFAIMPGSIARLKKGVSVAQAQAQMTALMRHLAETNRRWRGTGAFVTPLSGEIIETADGTRQTLAILFAATACVLLIGCVNVANLLLVRAATRHRELAVRAALGARRFHMARQVVVESVVLSAIGGVAGLLIAAWGTDLLVAAMPRGLFPRIEDVHVDWRVLAFGLVTSILAGLLAGLAPAWYTLRRDRRGTLSGSLRDSQRAGADGRGPRLLRRALVTVEVTLAMVLLVSATLLARTYVRLTGVDLGVRPDHVLTFHVSMPPTRYPTPDSRAAFAENLVSRLRAISGVQAAGITSSMPVGSQWHWSMAVTVEGQTTSDEDKSLSMTVVTDGYFEAAGVELGYGRLFTRDDANADVMIVSRAFVKRFWPRAPDRGPEPLGRLVTIERRACRIVGVVGNVKYEGPGGRIGEDFYVPFGRSPSDLAGVVLRATGDPMALIPAVRSAVRTLDADMALQDVQPLERVVSERVASPRFYLGVIGAFALLALMLATIGLYGLVAQSVAQRTQEIGIRLALGAGQRTIVSMVLREGVALTAAGIVAGVMVSLAVARVLATFLFGVTPTDPTTYALVALALLAVAVVACLMPARHASAIDPVVALRNE